MVKINHSNNINVKALLVGINYRGTVNALGGCINDVLTVKKTILKAYPYATIKLLTDDTNEKPTRSNILNKLNELVDSSNAGDILIVHYSGHGSQVVDVHGDEEDGYDETICPIDFMTNGQITDDEIHEIILKVPKGVKLLFISDSCHSGTIADLKNNFLNHDGSATFPDFQSTNTYNPQQTMIGNKINTEQQTTLNVSSSSNQPAVQHHNYFHQLYHQLHASSLCSYKLSDNVANININCQSSIVYVKHEDKHQVWVTPLDNRMYAIFNNKPYIIEVNIEQIPELLLKNPWRSFMFNTNFRQLNANDYFGTIIDLGSWNFLIKTSLQTTSSLGHLDLSRSNSISFNYSNRSLGNRTLSNGSLGNEHKCQIPYHYDQSTGKHNHINSLTGEKCAFSMRSPNSCNGGELRVISGCQDNQTSADTGKNGACTLAVLNTIEVVGGFPMFLKIMFSHNIGDLESIQRMMNTFLSKHGFTQQSLVSWDHSIGLRGLVAHNNLIAQRPIDNNVSMVNDVPSQVSMVDNIRPQMVTANYLPPQASMVDNIRPQMVTANYLPPQASMVDNIRPQRVTVNYLPPQASMVNNVRPQRVTVNCLPPQASMVNNVQPQFAPPAILPLHAFNQHIIEHNNHSFVRGRYFSLHNTVPTSNNFSVNRYGYISNNEIKKSNSFQDDDQNSVVLKQNRLKKVFNKIF